MTWRDFDWLHFEAQSYEDALHDRVRTIYQAAWSSLSLAYEKQKQHIDGELGKPECEEDVVAKAGLLDHEEFRFREQQSALTCMVFAMVASLTELHLDELKRYFNKSIPPEPKYPGDGHLLKLVAEYQQRFDIDL